MSSSWRKGGRGDFVCILEKDVWCPLFQAVSNNRIPESAPSCLEEMAPFLSWFSISSLCLHWLSQELVPAVSTERCLARDRLELLEAAAFAGSANPSSC